MRPQLGVESGRLLFRAAVSDTIRPNGPVRDAVERHVPSGDPAEVWHAARASAAGFVGGTADAETAILPIVVEDGAPVADVEARRIAAADALLANWVAVAAPSGPTDVLLVHVGEATTTARLVRFRPDALLTGLGADGTELKSVAFGLRNAVDAILDALRDRHHDHERPVLDAPLLRSILEYGLALQALTDDGEARWRGPYAARLWQPLELSLREYLAAASKALFAPMADEAAGLVAKGSLRVMFGGAGAFFPDAPAALAARLDRSMFSTDPGAVARGAARWREASTLRTAAPSLPPQEILAPTPTAIVAPPWAR